MPFEQGNSPLAVSYLSWRVAAEADAVVVAPPDHCEELSEMVIHQPCIQGLVEIHSVATVDNFLQLLHGIVAGGENVVIHQHKFCPSLDGYFVHIHIGPYHALFSWHHAPRAAVGASPCQEAVGGIFRDLRIDGVVGLQAVYLLRQMALDVVAGATADDFVGIVYRPVVGREIEDFAHIHSVVMEHRHRPFHIVALLPVPTGNLAQRKVGINRAAPLLFLAEAVDVNNSDFHNKMLLVCSL